MGGRFFRGRRRNLNHSKTDCTRFVFGKSRSELDRRPGAGLELKLFAPESPHASLIVSFGALRIPAFGVPARPSVDGREGEFPSVPMICHSPRWQFPPKAALWQHVVRVLPANSGLSSPEKSSSPSGRYQSQITWGRQFAYDAVGTKSRARYMLLPRQARQVCRLILHRAGAIGTTTGTQSLQP